MGLFHLKSQGLQSVGLLIVCMCFCIELLTDPHLMPVVIICKSNLLKNIICKSKGIPFGLKFFLVFAYYGI